MRPLLALAALILVAIGVAAYVSQFHQTDRPQYEKSEDEARALEEQSRKDAEKAKQKSEAVTADPNRQAAFDKVKDGAVRASMEIEGKGTVVMELYPKAAPKTVEHFVELAKKDFYSGILFHRVEPGFVVQGGDPESKKYKPSDLKGLSSSQVSSQFNLGSHDSGKSVPLEAGLPHLPMSVGLARSQDRNSGDCQFYINLKDNASLDGDYCVFGRVIEGQDIAGKIEIGDRIKSLKIE